MASERSLEADGWMSGRLARTTLRMDDSEVARAGSVRLLPVVTEDADAGPVGSLAEPMSAPSLAAHIDAWCAM
jgi:hypothetical protein